MKPRANYINPEQFQALIDYLPSLNIKKWNVNDIAMLFKISYWCGLRISEALRLSAEDFDHTKHEVFLGKTKTEKQAYTTLPPFFEPELWAWLEGKTGPLFPECNRFIVYNWLKRAGKALDITALITPQSESGENTKCHIFRKSIGKDMLYGTHTQGRKAPLNVVMKSLRHTNLDTTSKYLKVSNADVKDWWDQNTPKEESDLMKE